MAALLSFMSNSEPNFPFSIENHSQIYKPMFYFCFLVFFFTFFLLVVSYSTYKRLKKPEQNREKVDTQKPIRSDQLEFERALDEISGAAARENDPTHLTHSLLLEILPSDSPKWDCLFGEEKGGDPDSNGSGLDMDGADPGGGDQRVMKKKKKRAKKKRVNLLAEEGGGGGGGGSEERTCVERGNSGQDSRVKQELVCLYPFTSSSSAMQRRIKQQYDELVKCNETNGLTLAQVGDFANCLVEARSELQHKADVIQRKFTITKALLFKADRSSFDRLRQQIYKLELEQKRLEEDAFVYNWLQQQLKLSPAYKKMVEISASMELKAKSGELVESVDTDFADISFEDFLAQEKKDSFWQRNGKSRSFSSC